MVSNLQPFLFSSVFLTKNYIKLYNSLLGKTLKNKKMKTNWSLNLFAKNVKKDSIFWIIEESEDREGVWVRFVTSQNQEVHRQQFQDIPKGVIDENISKRLNKLAQNYV